MTPVSLINGAEAMREPAAKAVDTHRRDRNRASRTLTLTGLKLLHQRNS